MAPRKDTHDEQTSAQDALQEYLDLMLGKPTPAPQQSETAHTSAPPKKAEQTQGADESSSAAGPSTDIGAYVAPAVANGDSHVVKDSVQMQKDNAHTPPMPTALAENTDALQQKLLHARVKDLAEKSLQNAQATSLQAEDRRERMAAARDLIKQRIAARAQSAAVSAPGSPTPVADDVAARHHDDEPAVPPVEEIAHVHEAPMWMDNGRPVWAQGAFECLLFSVWGLTLAVPLIELGSIYPLRDPLTPIIGQIDWFLGLMRIEGRANLRTVNTAKIVMPEKYDPAFVEQIRYVISINGYDWGLAVDKIDKAVTLKPDDVRWRTERSRRPWLAGTVVDYMCALVDVQELAVMLSRADHGRPRLPH